MRPTADQKLAVIHMGGIAPLGTHGYLTVLLSDESTPQARADALANLRRLGGLMARFCNDYERAGQPARVYGT
jgi:hypothetical protein